MVKSRQATTSRGRQMETLSIGRFRIEYQVSQTSYSLRMIQGCRFGVEAFGGASFLCER